MPIAPTSSVGFFTSVQRRIMITIHNFNEAQQLYRSGLNPYRLLQDQAQVMLSLTTQTHVANAFEITYTNIKMYYNKQMP